MLLHFCVHRLRVQAHKKKVLNDANIAAVSNANANNIANAYNDAYGVPTNSSIGTNPFGQSSMSSNPFGQSSMSSNPFGQSSMSSNPFGQSSMSSNPFGQSSLSSNPFGQSSMSSNPFGQSSISSNPFGQSSMSSNPFGQSSLSSNPFGQSATSNNDTNNNNSNNFNTTTSSLGTTGYNNNNTSNTNATANNNMYGSPVKNLNLPTGLESPGNGMYTASPPTKPGPSDPSYRAGKNLINPTSNNPFSLQHPTNNLNPMNTNTENDDDSIMPSGFNNLKMLEKVIPHHNHSKTNMNIVSPNQNNSIVETNLVNMGDSDIDADLQSLNTMEIASSTTGGVGEKFYNSGLLGSGINSKKRTLLKYLQELQLIRPRDHPLPLDFKFDPKTGMFVCVCINVCICYIYVYVFMSMCGYVCAYIYALVVVHVYVYACLCIYNMS